MEARTIKILLELKEKIDSLEKKIEVLSKEIKKDNKNKEIK